MEILLTNDDGIGADTLWALHEVLQNLGDVTVVAPDAERSGVGHAITYREPVRVESVETPTEQDVYKLSGTPADCVKFGLLNIFDDSPDLIVSGINPGLNLGCNLFYSGTVAAAIEGVMNGVCSIALSCAPDGLDRINRLAQQAAQTVESLSQRSCSSAVGYNVNLPDPSSTDPALVFTRHHTGAFEERYVRTETPDAFQLDLPYGQFSTIDHPCDVSTIQNGNISVTPLRADLNHDNFLDELNS